MGDQRSAIEGSEDEMEVSYMNSDINMHIYQIQKKTDQLVCLVIIDLIINSSCLLILLQFEHWSSLMEWNGLLSGGFIILACFDGVHLLFYVTNSSVIFRVVSKMTRIVYIVSLFSAWLMNTKRVYQKRQCDSKLGVYLFFGSFITLVLPFCYCYYLGVVKHILNERADQEIQRLSTLINYGNKPHQALVLTMVLFHPVIYLVLKYISIKELQEIHYFHSYYPSTNQQTFSM